MSNNPYVNINRVIDTAEGNRKIVDFLHLKRINNKTVAISSFVASGDTFYADITDQAFNLKQMPIVIIDDNVDLTRDYSNFTGCAMVNVSGAPRLRLYSKLKPIGVLTIPTIVLIETGGTNPIQGLLRSSGSGGGSSDWVYDSTKLSVFGEYLANLGGVQEEIDDIKDFLATLSQEIYTGSLNADVIAAGTIKADKLEINSKNIISRFDSFEQYVGQAIAGTAVNITSASVINTEAKHGGASLRIITSAGSASKYINPFKDNTDPWLTVKANGNYYFSYWVKVPGTKPTNITGSVDIYSKGVLKYNLPFIILTTDNDWVRFYTGLGGTIPVALATTDALTFRINITQGGVTAYFDAIQLEKDSLTDFAASGRILLEGGNLAADTITADEITTNAITSDKINANAITADKIDANAITTDKINANAITTEKIAAGAVTATEIAADAITAEKINAGAVTADAIAAGAITTEKLAAESITTDKLVTTGKNYISYLDSFEAMVGKPILGLSYGISEVEALPDNTLPEILGNASLRIISNNVEGEHYKYLNPFKDDINNWLKLEASTTYTLSGYVKANNGYNVPVKLGLQSTTETLAETSYINLNSDEWTRISVSYTSIDEIGASIKLTFLTTGANAPIIYLDGLQLEIGVLATDFISSGQILLSGGQLSANSISASSIQADAIVAEKIAANAVEARSIKANAVSAEKIQAGAITTEKLETNSINAEKIQISSKNIISRFDGFEQYPDQEILGASENIILAFGDTSHTIFGNVSLRLETDSAPSYKYLNPFFNNDKPWLSIKESGSYFFSYYLKIPTEKTLDVTGRIEIWKNNDILVTFVPFIIPIGQDDWVRFYTYKDEDPEGIDESFNLIIDDVLTFKIIVDQENVILYLDAIQLELNEISEFTPSGRILIEGGNIAAETIRATEIAALAVTAEKIAADAITADKIKAQEINSTHLKTEFGEVLSVLKIGPIPNQVIISGTEDTGKIFTGAGNHAGRNTGFYLDSDSNFSLSNQLIFTPGDVNSLSELEITGKIKGIIEGVEQIPTTKFLVGIIDIVVLNETGIVNTTGHNFLTNERILIEGISEAEINKEYIITSVIDSTSFTIGMPSITDAAYTGISPVATLRELTLGFHLGESISDSEDRLAGTGLRLDKYNYWMTNNQFRVGTKNSSINWNGDRFKISGSGTKDLLLSVGSLDNDNIIAISNSGFTPTFNREETPFYVDGSGRFSLGTGLTWQDNQLNIIGNISFISNNEIIAVPVALEEINQNKANVSYVTEEVGKVDTRITSVKTELVSEISSISSTVATFEDEIGILESKITQTAEDVTLAFGGIDDIKSYYRFSEDELSIGKPGKDGVIKIGFSGDTAQITISDGNNETAVIQSNNLIISNAQILTSLSTARHKIQVIPIGGIQYTVFLPQE